MVDFKKTFAKSNLLYGKDKEGGYFAVCVDQADFNKLTDTLEEAGWLRDEILACCLPQIFDRSNLTK
jgi:predicted RNase H-like HicB family nuclease